MKKQKLSIVGFGRFGKTLLRLFKDDFDVTIYDVNKKYSSEKDIFKSEVIFYAVPINKFENVIKKHRKYYDKHLLVDVLSVKTHPRKIFSKYLKGTNARAILTHPMFGPDSSRNGFDGLTIVVDKFTANNFEYKFWKKYFKNKGLRVEEMTAEEHDKLAADSQGVTHFIGRLLDKIHFNKTSIDTLGAKKLHEIMDQTCNDTWELFSNLQTFNPYTRNMRYRLGKAFDELYSELLPKRISPGKIIFGIQGGKGSFNEQALTDYVRRNNINSFDIKYLYTTEKVLLNLYKGLIDYGLFATHNSEGGIVEESVIAMAHYKYSIVENFSILIEHYLMKRKDIKTDQIKTIMAHPQVLKQCKITLTGKYPNLELTSGKDDLIDTAKAASALSKNKLSPDVAILGPKNLSELYNLEIIDQKLQDNPKNRTSFLLVERYYP